ncbi:unnamed protein product, partial [Iphiclides podalirius]
MRRAGWCSLAAAAAIAAIAATAAAATVGNGAGGGSSDESLRQALVLVEILKSGILRKSHHAMPATPLSLADYAGYRLWPPPYAPLFHSKGLPFRRTNDANGGEHAGRRLGKDAPRQMDYEDQFGPQPGGDGASAQEVATEGSTSQQTDSQMTQKPAQSSTTQTADTKSTQTTVSETKAATTTEATTKSFIKETNKTTEKENTKAPVKLTTFNTETSRTPTQIKTKKHMKLNTIPKAKKRENFKVTSKVSTANPGDVIRLKYKKDGAPSADVHGNADGGVPEIAQAALELQREAADTGDLVEHRCPNRARTSPEIAQTSCPGGDCEVPLATSRRYKGSTRVYLSRSSRPPVPLPANNAFCYTDPDSPLCRTFI